MTARHHNRQPRPATLTLARGWRRWVACGSMVMGALASEALALNPTENPSAYIVNHWDAEEGLPHNAIKQIFQTHDGYLWVGTMQGLARFDGLTFTTFNQHNTPGFPNNQITAFAET